MDRRVARPGGHPRPDPRPLHRRAVPPAGGERPDHHRSGHVITGAVDRGGSVSAISCLIGKRFRDELDERFARLYHDLERGTDALAYVDPYAPIESFRRRDEARRELVDLVQGIMDARTANPPARKEDRDMLDVLISIRDEDGDPRFSASEITGMFISMMFAGHHTTSGTAAWSVIELLRHPEQLAAVVAELDELYADGSDISFGALRQIPKLAAMVKETLRLLPQRPQQDGRATTAALRGPLPQAAQDTVNKRLFGAGVPEHVRRMSFRNRL